MNVLDISTSGKIRKPKHNQFPGNAQWSDNPNHYLRFNSVVKMFANKNQILIFLVALNLLCWLLFIHPPPNCYSAKLCVLVVCDASEISDENLRLTNKNDQLKANPQFLLNQYIFTPPFCMICLILEGRQTWPDLFLIFVVFAVLTRSLNLGLKLYVFLQKSIFLFGCNVSKYV